MQPQDHHGHGAIPDSGTAVAVQGKHSLRRDDRDKRGVARYAHTGTAHPVVDTVLQKGGAIIKWRYLEIAGCLQDRRDMVGDKIGARCQGHLGGRGLGDMPGGIRHCLGKGDGGSIGKLLHIRNKRRIEVRPGGALFTLADTVTGTAAYTIGDRPCVTLDSSMQFLAAARGDKVFCVATPKKIGRTIVVYDVALTDGEERLVASGTFTFFVK